MRDAYLRVVITAVVTAVLVNLLAATVFVAIMFWAIAVPLSDDATLADSWYIPFLAVVIPGLLVTFYVHRLLARWVVKSAERKTAAKISIWISTWVLCLLPLATLLVFYP